MPWARENELWKGLDPLLDDFSNFQEVPPEAYKLWEHYLVFAIIFGNAKKILKMLPIILQDERSSAPAWYLGFDRAGLAGMGRNHRAWSRASNPWPPRSSRPALRRPLLFGARRFQRRGRRRGRGQRRGRTLVRS